MINQIDLLRIEQIAMNAGGTIMAIYEKDFAVAYKDDNSPLTEADTRSNEVICSALTAHYPEIPILSEENKKQLWIPPGFAHGFYVLSKWAEIIYKATDFYHPESERTLLWNDPEINIEWPIAKDVPLRLSPKDKRGIPFKNADIYTDPLE